MKIKGAGQNNEMPGSDILVGGKSDNISTEELINELEDIKSSDNSSSSSSTSEDVEYIENLSDSSSSSTENSEISSFIASSSLIGEPSNKTITTVVADISSSSITTSNDKYGAKNSQSGGMCSVKVKSNIKSNFKSDNLDNYIIKQKLYDTSDSIFST